MHTDEQAFLMPLAEIKLGERQRKDLGDLAELTNSIQKNGLLQPLVVTRDGTLIAGERRLAALRAIDPDGLAPVRLFDTLPHRQQQILELEENVRRKDLTWQEEALAVYRIFGLMVEEEPELSQGELGLRIGYSQQHVSRLLNVGEALTRGDEQVLGATGLRAADEILQRKYDRILDNIMSGDGGATDTGTGTGTSAPDPAALSFDNLPGVVVPHLRDLPDESLSHRIVQADFLSWAAAYRGTRFNFIHCDFPYGIEHGMTEQAGGANLGTYADSRELNEQLIQSLVKHQDTLFAPTAHMIFWFSMNHYQWTKEQLERLHDAVVFPFPLIWHKSNRGMMPDALRQPQRRYETAFLVSIGDRKLLRATSNLVEFPIEEKQHISEKPSIMLERFFQMLVDEHTRMLDPTCGTGNAVTAAIRLHAELAVGIELDIEHATYAKGNIRREQEALHAEVPA